MAKKATAKSASSGRIFPVSSSAAPRKQQEGELGLKERWYPIEVKKRTRSAVPTLTPLKP
jgi:hypothetical protein